MYPSLRSLALLSVALCGVSCTAQRFRITDITDMPLKDIHPANMSWQVSPIRAHTQYVLYGTQSVKEQKDRLGDYYFVNWYDADPTRSVKLEMLYTQARTASKTLSCVVEFKEPRSSAGSRKSVFSFNGPERAKNGDIMTWRINLYVDGAMVDSRHSYLWQDSPAAPAH